jgi:hypothetical protein
MWHVWGRRFSCRVLVGITERRRKLGRSGRRWADIIKMVLQEVGWKHGLE